MEEVFTAIKPLKSIYKMPFSTYRLVLLQAAGRRSLAREAFSPLTQQPLWITAPG